MPLLASDDDIGDLGDMADVVCVMGVVAVIAAVGESEALVLGRRRAAVEGGPLLPQLLQPRPSELGPERREADAESNGGLAGVEVWLAKPAASCAGFAGDMRDEKPPRQ